MNAQFDEGPNENAAALARTDAFLYILQQMSKSEMSVLRTKLIWQEGLFCDGCKQRELITREELRTGLCKKCAHKQFLEDRKNKQNG